MSWKVFSTMAAVGLAMMCQRAEAGFYTIGAPGDAGTWGPGLTWFQTWGESGVGPFDQIEAIARPASSIFDTPGLTSFVPSGFVDYDVSTAHAVAAGASLSSLQFNTVFTVSPSSTVIFDIYAFNGNTIADSVRATWNGSTWSYSAADPTATRTPVPEPTALVLLPLGALILRAVRRGRNS